MGVVRNGVVRRLAHLLRPVKRPLFVPVTQISEHRKEERPFRTIKDALWARYGKEFGKLLDSINKRTVKK